MMIMTQDISIILVFELRSILAGKTRDWNEFNTVGSCLIPQLIIEELDYLTKRATNPDDEKTAREFMRFFPDSGWQTSMITSPHASLSASEGENMSKNARLQLATAESVSAIALSNSDKLIVFVANNNNLKNQIEELNISNLSTLTLTQFTQWIRTKQLPINVSQKKSSLSSNNKEILTSTPTAKPKKSSNQRAYTYQSRAKVKKKENPLSFIIPSVLTVAGVLFVGILSWYLVQPDSFNQFLEKIGIPSQGEE